jgi:hypothetical protein
LIGVTASLVSLVSLSLPLVSPSLSLLLSLSLIIWDGHPGPEVDPFPHRALSVYK